MTNEEALADLKAKVGEFMDDAKKMAMHRIDKLQNCGADIVGDHIRVTESDGNWLIPRDFIAAFSDEMKHQYGFVTKRPCDRGRNKRIKNYWRLM